MLLGWKGQDNRGHTAAPLKRGRKMDHPERTQQSRHTGVFVAGSSVRVGVLVGPIVRVLVRVGEGPQVAVRVGVLLGRGVRVLVRVGEGPHVAVRVGVGVGGRALQILLVISQVSQPGYSSLSVNVKEP